MIFPILFGHMTFASHRCWTVYVKKAVFQAAEAWRKRYGSSVRHAAIKAGGGEIIQHFRQGMDPYPLQGWRYIDIDGQRLLENPHGQRCATTAEAYDIEYAQIASGGSEKDTRAQLSFLQKFLNQCCSERLDQEEEGEDGPVRQIVTTSPLEDWLWRGDHPILKDMHWYVYSMWVFRVEKLPLKRNKDGEAIVPGPRFIDIEFSPDYKLHHTHKQRIATEFRVPLYQGFTMPPTYADKETAAMYKSLLLRALSVEVHDQPEDLRFADAFAPLSEIAGRDLDGNEAFSKAWQAYAVGQKKLADEAERLFLDRYEYMSLWETQEVQDELNAMWDAAEDLNFDDEVAPPDGMSRRCATEGVADPD